MKISIVSPVYKAESILPTLVSRIELAMKDITNDYEIILVEDCGPDSSWEVIVELAKTNPKLRGIKLSRNFGQHYAITAGLNNVKGEWVVVMDCDLQDQPEEIIKLYEKAIEGFDVVLASRKVRLDNFAKKFFSRQFYKILSFLTGMEHDSSIANFGIYHQKVIQSINQMPESIRYFPAMVTWVGFKSTKVEVDHASRLEGVTSYNFQKLMHLAIDIILANSDKPLRIVVKAGLLISAFSVVIAIKTLLNYLNGEIIVLGYASMLISIWLLSGVIIATLGIVGLYVGKTFQGVKKRPNFIIDKIIGAN
jgi:dolichol-phosphate mannosyltransferase